MLWSSLGPAPTGRARIPNDYGSQRVADMSTAGGYYVPHFTKLIPVVVAVPVWYISAPRQRGSFPTVHFHRVLKKLWKSKGCDPPVAPLIGVAGTLSPEDPFRWLQGSSSPYDGLPPTGSDAAGNVPT